MKQEVTMCDPCRPAMKIAEDRRLVLSQGGAVLMELDVCAGHRARIVQSLRSQGGSAPEGRVMTRKKAVLGTVFSPKVRRRRRVMTPAGFDRQAGQRAMQEQVHAALVRAGQPVPARLLAKATGLQSWQVKQTCRQLAVEGRVERIGWAKGAAWLAKPARAAEAVG